MSMMKNTTVRIALIAGLISVLVYLRALTCDFTNYDDSGFITNNHAFRILDREFLEWAFTTSYMGWWMPLIWLSFALDYHFWNLNPVGFHLTNILLHAINTGLVVLIADRLCRNLSVSTQRSPEQKYLYSAVLLMSGLLFALHPMNVESVVWVSERKNMLNGIFSLGSILLYLKYTQINESSGGKRAAVINYCLSVLLLLLALMTKPVSVVIPVLLLVADWYPLGRLRKGNILPILAEKAPYLILSALLSVVILSSASGEKTLVPLSSFSIIDRCIQSGAAVFEYLAMMLYPVDIVVLELIPKTFPVSFMVKSAAVVIFTCYCVYSARRRPWLLAIWCGFVIPLLPSLHFFINGASSTAAHFVYLPSVTLSIAAAATLALAYKKSAAEGGTYQHKIITILIVALLVFYVAMTERLIGSWKNSETLWTRVINLRPAGRAFYYRADYYMDAGNYTAAIVDLSTSIRMAEQSGYPEVFTLYALLGETCIKNGQYPDAVAALTSAINLYPLPNYYYHRGVALKAMGKIKEAEENFSHAGSDTGPVMWENLYQNGGLEAIKAMKSRQ